MSDNDWLWKDRREELLETVVQRGRARKRRRALAVTTSALILLVVLAVGVYQPAHRNGLVRVAGPGSGATSTTLLAPSSSTTSPSVAAALSTFLSEHDDIAVHTDPFTYENTNVALVGFEHGGRDRSIGIVSISNGVAQQIGSLTLPSPYYDFASDPPTVADLTGDGTPDVLFRFEAADNSPGVVVSGDGNTWRLVPESSRPADIYIGRNPTINNGRLTTIYDDCIPDCAAGHSTTRFWHYDRISGILVSG